MNIDDKAIETLAKLIKQSFDMQSKDLSLDWSIKCKVTASLGNGEYRVSKGGREYSPTSINGMSFSKGDTVWVLFPSGVIEDGFIIGKQT